MVSCEKLRWDAKKPRQYQPFLVWSSKNVKLTPFCLSTGLFLFSPFPSFEISGQFYATSGYTTFCVGSIIFNRKKRDPS